MGNDKTYHFNTVWTMEKIRKDFKHFKTLTELKSVLGKTAWKAAVKWDKQFPGFLDEVAKHIERKTRWTEDKMFSELELAIKSFIKITGFPPTLQNLRTDAKYGKVISAFKNRKNQYNLPELVNSILKKIGLDYPKESGYIVHGSHFSGFYEAVGFCFMKEWGLNVVAQPKVFDKYKSDGYLTDYDIYWEHWGGLNKNNPEKKTLYEETNTKLISTYDDEVYKKGINFYYNKLKELLVNNGVKIDYKEGEDFNPLTLVKGEMVNLKWIYDEYKSEFGNQEPKDKLFKEKDSPLLHRIRRYFGGLDSFVEYCNENFYEKWDYQVRNYEGDDINNVMDKVTRLIKELKRFPTANELRNYGYKGIVDSILKYHGGLESFKRNEYEEGINFKYVSDILEEESPYDKTYDFSNEEQFDWAVKYITKINGGKFPKFSNEIIKLFKNKNCKVTEYFYYSVRKNGSSKYNTWSEFQEDYFNDGESKTKRFKDSDLTYNDFKNILDLLSEGLSYEKISKKTGHGSATIGRIKRKERFLDFFDQHEKEYTINSFGS